MAEGGHKVLLFSQFTSMLERLKSTLPKKNLILHADGSTPKVRRMELVESFNKRMTRRFSVFPSKAGGTGPEPDGGGHRDSF